MVAARGRRSGHVRPVDRARLAGVGRCPSHVPSGASARPVTLQGTGDPAVELLRGTGQSRQRRCGSGRCAAWSSAGAPAIGPWPRSLRRGGMGGFTVVATALGYPAVPRYLVVPVAICCVVAGIGAVAVVHLATGPRGRAALAVALVA